MFEGSKKISKKDWFVLTVLGLVLTFTFFVEHADGKLHVYFLDVGQGDAIFVETPSGKQVLVDGGPGNIVLQRLAEVMPLFDKSIDLVVSTHPDADHLSGLVSVLERYGVPKILETGMQCDTSLCGQWQEVKKEKQPEITDAFLGQEIDVGDGVKFLVFNPTESLSGKFLPKRNNGGIILKLVYGSQSVLLTADVEKPVEEKLVQSGVKIDSDFLKVAHHGSKTSSTENFLKKTSPLLAFIEVGKDNKYGHPTREVLQRLEDFKIPYYRTDMDGTVELVLDGKDYVVKMK